SRRRHTRSYGDWSSDVCSSDLNGNTCTLTVHLAGDGNGEVDSMDGQILCVSDGAPGCSSSETKGTSPTLTEHAGPGSVFSYWGEIGRASCRERVEWWGWDESEW